MHTLSLTGCYAVICMSRHMNSTIEENTMYITCRDIKRKQRRTRNHFFKSKGKPAKAAHWPLTTASRHRETEMGKGKLAAGNLKK